MNVYFLFFLIIIILFFHNYDQIRIWMLNILVINRGIISLNCFWYNVSESILKDGAGIHLYNDLKKKYGDFPKISMFREDIYLVTNNEYIKVILDNSPDLFSVGKLKMDFFKSFMAKNVGVSTGCPWKRRRKINETALDTDKLHRYSEKYSQDIHNNLTNWRNKSVIEYTDFLKFGKYVVSKIVFNDDIDDDIFKIFSEANTLECLINPNFQIDHDIYEKYMNILNNHITHPRPKSLIALCVSASNDNDEILHQIPHFIFPIIGLFVTTLPRLLLLIFNDKNILQNVIEDIANTVSMSFNIHSLSFLRKCILETLRLNNPVTTTFRTLAQDFAFDEKHVFQKGTQFLILNNPVLREKKYFKDPNKFIPERWTQDMEQSYYAISFNQGPQRCPGKELAIYLVQCFIYHFFKIKHITMNTIIETNSINVDDVPQAINPCNLQFKIH